MKNILARGGIEFIAVLLGITGSLWIDENRKAQDQNEKQVMILQAVYEDIIQTEKFIEERRDPAFQADSTWMDYFANHWDDMNIDSEEDQDTSDISVKSNYSIELTVLLEKKRKLYSK